MGDHRIGTIDEFPENRGRRVSVDGIDIAVFNVEGDLFGVLNMCPHKKLPLHAIGSPRQVSQELIDEGHYCPNTEADYGWQDGDNQEVRGSVDADELTIRCPWHYLEIDLETGRMPVKNANIATFDVTVESDGAVFVEI